MPGPKTVRVEAPADMDPLDIAQAVVGPHVLLKAEANKPTGSARTFQDYKAMATLSKRFEAAYRKQLDKIVQKIREYVEKRIILGPLGKADGPKKPVVTPAQLRDLRQIIEDYHQAFIAGTIGPDTLKPADVQRLIDAGILPADIGYTFQPGVRELPPAAMNAIEDAYRYGHVLAASRTLDEKRLRGKITYDQFVTEYAPRTPLTPAELNAIEWLKHSAATEIVGLGNRVADNFATTAIEADAELRRKYMGLIREALEENVERRDTWRKLASDLGHKTGDWARDFGRIAATEKSKAMQEGVASGLIKEYGDPEDVRVAKLPNPGACPDCVRLHYTAGEGSTLRIFKLSELVGNGTNVGKKRAAWEATVGPVHPWCLPAGAMVTTVRGHVPIERIRVGDEVLTHRGRFRRVQRLSQRFYRGDVVVLAVGDQLLEATPEHPVLTCHGWAVADSLRLGAHVFRHVTASIPDTDLPNRPANEEQVSDLESILVPFAHRRVPVAGVDLDGDPLIGERQIDVEKADRHLGHGLQAIAAEEIVDGALVLRQSATLLPGLGAFELLLDGARFAADCIVSGLRTTFAFGRRLFRSVEDALFRDRSDSDTRLLQARGDRPPGRAVASCEHLDAHASLVGTDDTADRQMDALHGYRAVAVTSVTRKPFVGRVYNFSVEDDESYVANGIVNHNCGCELIHVPEGMGFDDDNNLLPLPMLRSDYLEGDLRKAMPKDSVKGKHLTYGKTVPDKGCVIRIGDPRMRAAVEKIIAMTPPEIFDKRIGITLITTDIPRPQNPFDEPDYAYWTGNEIRIMQTLPADKIPRVLPHEIGHSLNVHLMHKLGGVEPVRKWHDKLWAVSKKEGWVSNYAKRMPIENAAEVTMNYLYHRRRMMIRWPRQFAFCHKWYGDIWKNAKLSERGAA
jgi:hypothetical protein